MTDIVSPSAMILGTFLILLNYVPPFLSILDTADLETPTWRATAAGKEKTLKWDLYSKAGSKLALALFMLNG
jgi:hypothetical protein